MDSKASLNMDYAEASVVTEWHHPMPESDEASHQSFASEPASNVMKILPFQECGEGDDARDLPMDLDDDIAKGQPAVDVVDIVESVLHVKNSAAESIKDVEANGHYPISSSDGSIKWQVEESDLDMSETKRIRGSSTEPQPVVRVIYSHLTRSSKKKLEDLMQSWSQWHATSHSSTDSLDDLESGEGVYFPALCVGPNKSPVPFWVDNQAKQEEAKTFASWESDLVPLYDRGYSLGLTALDDSPAVNGKEAETEASRCFNCGSYNHSMKECTKPHDIAAVCNARKQHSLKRKKIPGRFYIRYYQESPLGKFEGLVPGVLSPETRQCMGISEHDPPPWMNRMREIGCSPGYKDTGAKDQPSGITIFTGDEPVEAPEEGEIGKISEVEIENQTTEDFQSLNSSMGNGNPFANSPAWEKSPMHQHSSRSSHSKRIGEGLFSDQGWSRDLVEKASPSSGIYVTDQYASRNPGYARLEAGRLSSGCRYNGYRSPSLKGNENTGRYRGHDSPRECSVGYPLQRSPMMDRSLSERSWRSHLASASPSAHNYSDYSPQTPLNLIGPSTSDFERWDPSSHERDLEMTSSERKHRAHHYRNRK